MTLDNLGTRMKMYEQRETKRFMPLLPVMVRLDGRSFSKFTRGLRKPYDMRMVNLMHGTTKWLVRETAANMGYTQSDEITLTYLIYGPKAEIFFSGKIQKMVSTLSAMASVRFNSMLRGELKEKRDEFPTFDCRAWQVPNVKEGANAFLWREQDATKNSIQSATRSVYSHKEVLGVNTREMHDMLHAKGINWNDYPDFFKRGTYFQRKKTSRKFTTDELSVLPERHAARTNPDLEVIRTDVVKLDMPTFSKVANRERVIFRGEEPEQVEE